MLEDTKQNGKTAYDLLPDYKKEGINIGIVRRQKKITQKQLGEKVGLTNFIVGRIESGHRRCDCFEISNFAQALGVPMSRLSPYIDRDSKSDGNKGLSNQRDSTRQTF
jgi:transcriptional regulator with XRE-family HTH domain